MSKNSATGKSILSFLIPLAIGAIIWFYPVPAGLTPQAWHMFAIFAATIAAILTQPLPSGAVMLIALCVVIFTKTLPEAKALSGFASGTVWLIFCAYVLSLGFVTSGLGKRIAYKMLSLFGGSSLRAGGVFARRRGAVVWRNADRTGHGRDGWFARLAPP